MVPTKGSTNFFINNNGEREIPALAGDPATECRRQRPYSRRAGRSRTFRRRLRPMAREPSSWTYGQTDGHTYRQSHICSID